ncbi:MAG: hypothetical protein CL878_12415 [Dehalococcoidia bacterium]|nr:hypothetical protein [Dehalococcoidia bacterium]
MKPQLLFVDDEDHVLEGLKLSLRNQRKTWEMHFASSGQAALDLSQQQDFDLIVTDARMPGMSGVALLQALRGGERTVNIPTIMLTGSLAGDVRQAALKAGAVEFLNKPVDPEELVLRLRNVLRLKQISDELQQKNGQLEEQNRKLIQLGRQLHAANQELARHATTGSPDPAPQ